MVGIAQLAVDIDEAVRFVQNRQHDLIVPPPRLEDERSGILLHPVCQVQDIGLAQQCPDAGSWVADNQ